jgi:soluble lytic murein transglycosylase-like protein
MGQDMRRIIFGVIAMVCAGAFGQADAEGLRKMPSSKSRMELFREQTKLLDTRLSKQYDASVRLKPKRAGGDVADLPGGDVADLPRYSGRYKGQYLEAAKSAARKHGVPEDLFLRLVQQESGWNHVAVSTKGATGLAQLMPGTAELLNVDINDPEENLDGGAKYLRRMYDRFGDWKLALAAYNAGPGAVEKHDGIPPYAETKNYVASIMGG